MGLGYLYDKKFRNISNGLHGFAIQMPAFEWKKTYTLSSPTIRVVSLPGTFRAVVLVESEEEGYRLFEMLNHKVMNMDDEDEDVEPTLPILRKLLYSYIEDKIVGSAVSHVVSSLPDIMFDDEEPTLVVMPTADDVYRLQIKGTHGSFIMRTWFVPIGKTEDILYLMAALPTMNVSMLRESVQLPPSVKIPDVLSSGVIYERVGKTFIIGSWIFVKKDDEEDALSFMDNVFSMTSIDFLPQQMVKRDTLDAFRKRLYASLAIMFNRPSARLRTLMDITAPMGSKLMPEDIIALIPRLDLIGFRRIFRIIRNSTVKDLVATSEVLV